MYSFLDEFGNRSELSERLNRFFMCGANMSAQSLSNQVGIGSRSDCFWMVRHKWSVTVCSIVSGTKIKSRVVLFMQIEHCAGVADSVAVLMSTIFCSKYSAKDLADKSLSTFCF